MPVIIYIIIANHIKAYISNIVFMEPVLDCSRKDIFLKALTTFLAVYIMDLSGLRIFQAENTMNFQPNIAYLFNIALFVVFFVVAAGNLMDIYRFGVALVKQTSYSFTNSMSSTEENPNAESNHSDCRTVPSRNPGAHSDTSDSNRQLYQCKRHCRNHLHFPHSSLVRYRNSTQVDGENLRRLMENGKSISSNCGAIPGRNTGSNRAASNRIRQLLHWNHDRSKHPGNSFHNLDTYSLRNRHRVKMAGQGLGGRPTLHRTSPLFVFIAIAIMVIASSAALDLYKWFAFEWYVPSFVVTALCIGFLLSLGLNIHLLEKDGNEKQT